jgi:hypothetical protein
MVQLQIYDRSGAYPGTKVNGKHEFILPFTAVAGSAGIPFGLILMALNAAFDKAGLPYAQKITLVNDSESGDTITGKVVIGGTVNDVSQAWNTSNSHTLDLLATAIGDLDDSEDPSIDSVVVSGNSVTVVPVEGREVYFKGFSVAGGAAPEIEYSITGKLLCMSKRKAKERREDGTVKYLNEDLIDGVLEGVWWIKTEETSINPVTDQVFVRILDETDKQVGILKKSSDSGKAIPCPELKFASGVEDGLVAVTMRL